MLDRCRFHNLADGLLFGNPAQLDIQAAAIGAAIVYGGVVVFVLLKIIGVVIPLRTTMVDQGVGLDITQHGEVAYQHGDGGGQEG